MGKRAGCGSYLCGQAYKATSTEGLIFLDGWWPSSFCTQSTEVNGSLALPKVLQSQAKQPLAAKAAFGSCFRRRDKA